MHSSQHFALNLRTCYVFLRQFPHPQKLEACYSNLSEAN